jgi:hypothetical protein
MKTPTARILLGLLGLPLIASQYGCHSHGYRDDGHDHSRDIIITDPHGYNHEGYYDEDKHWHGGYYDEQNNYHEDPRDYHDDVKARS